MTEQRLKVLVGLSGGVDSSVAAALLLADGHEVVGGFMKNWSDTKDPLTGECAWRAERDDAERVAARLGIPFHVFDFEEVYRAAVVQYLLHEYAVGRTPNPDVLCNREVKFGPFMAEADRLGCTHVATGHYARVERGSDGAFRLLTGLDPNKDQSYFLHQLNQAQLARTLFPIGHLAKPEVRRLAAEFRLPTATKKDSQGICFVGKVNLKEFLAPRLTQRPGPIVTVDGHVVGVHQGMAPFTIGQRHGLNLGGGEPYFVVDKDPVRNAVIVARGESHPELFASSAITGRIHWISGAAPTLPLDCQVRLRYRQPSQYVQVAYGDNGSVHLHFPTPQRAVAPGQFAVLYDGETCLGGGEILRAERGRAAAGKQAAGSGEADSRQLAAGSRQ